MMTNLSLSQQINNPERSYFEQPLKRLEQDVLRMGALVEESFRMSHQALFGQQLETPGRIIQLEKEIDRLYRHIEEECSSFLTLQAPVAQDLRLLSAVMQLVRDLERIGDYAQDLGEIALKMTRYPPHPCMKEIAAMSWQAQHMLDKSLICLTQLDPDAGPIVKKMDDVVDDAYDRLYKVLAFQRDIKGVVEPILLMTLVIRHLERMADHATNIAQRVSYIVTGKRS